MGLFPDLPLSTDAHLGGTRPLSSHLDPPRSHLVTPGGPKVDPLRVAQAAGQGLPPDHPLALLAELRRLQRRVTRLKDYLESRSWSARWMRLKVWWRNLPSWMAKFSDLITKRRKR